MNELKRRKSNERIEVNSLSFFPPGTMVRVMRDVVARAALTVFTMPWLLQYLTPEALHRLEVRWGTTVFKFVYRGGF